jgi:hypothetical protein
MQGAMYHATRDVANVARTKRKGDLTIIDLCEHRMAADSIVASFRSEEAIVHEYHLGRYVERRRGG